MQSDLATVFVIFASGEKSQSEQLKGGKTHSSSFLAFISAEESSIV